MCQRVFDWQHFEPEWLKVLRILVMTKVMIQNKYDQISPPGRPKD